MKRIAIVTVTYNAEQEIEKTLNSVLVQDCLNLHYYVMDGQSTDDTVNILMRYRQAFLNSQKNYLVTCQKDNGIYDAMNASLDLIEEDYVLFLNAGDYLAGEHVISLVEDYLNKNECDICYGDFYVYSGNKRKKVISGEPSELPNGMISTHQTFFTKTELLRMYKYDTKYKMAADFNFYLNMFLLGKKFLHFHEVVVYFQIGGISQKKAQLTQKEVVAIKKNSLKLDEEAVQKLQKRIPLICFKKKLVAVLPDFVRYYQYENFK